MTREPPISLEEAQARLLALAKSRDIKRLEIEAALGYYLAEPLLARRTQPNAALSAMDGYAVGRHDHLGPWHVVGESAAGHPFASSFSHGEAIRVSTGAVIPDGTASVILQEDLDRDGDRIALTGEGPSPYDKHIRRRGLDFFEGQQILAAGTAIGPAQLALALSAGHRQMSVYSAPRVLVMDSGDELAADPEACLDHQIPASNGAMLAAMARALPCDVQRIGPIPDTMAALADALDQGSDADVIVTSGGASVGDHDLVRPALEAWGAQIDFWRVAIRPGKPILIATRDNGARRQIVLGLPGNPVSSHVTATLFMLPLLRALLGASQPLPAMMTVRMRASLPPNGARRTFLRASWNGHTAIGHAVQDSSALATLAASNVLIDRPANAGTAKKGDEVPAVWIGQSSIA